MGIDTARYKTLAFGTSTLFTGVAGALAAIVVGYVSPEGYSLFLSVSFLVGSAVGVLAWLAPGLVGGGDNITQGVLAGAAPLAAIPAAFLIRFALGAVSYAAGTPGGLFAPMLVLGAQFGFLCGAACQAVLPGLNIQPEGFAVVGIAAFFAGVVRAPITGLVLATEMTDSVSMLLPMLSACATAMLTPALIGDPPIYESLREPTEKRD